MARRGRIWLRRAVFFAPRRISILQQHAPQILKEFERGLALTTVRCSCDYLAEAFEGASLSRLHRDHPVSSLDVFIEGPAISTLPELDSP